MVCAGLLAFVSNAQAAVTIYFEQDGNDVIVSAEGVLDVTGTTPPTSLWGLARQVGPEVVRNVASPIWKNEVINSAGKLETIATLQSKSINSGDPNGLSFGYTKGGHLVYNNDDLKVNGGNKTITWSRDRNYMVFDNTTLADLGAESLSHKLAFTVSGTGDTISLQTVAVPEPSSALLMGLGGFALILRRRK